MKLHKITLHNIASFADASVDFDAEPLASASVFLITGRVGAGKSTLLDAISLALFGITPRLKSTRASSTFGKFDDAGVMTPRQLLRSGCAEGRAELLFSAGGNRYRASWTVERVKATGVNELEDLSNGHTYTGAEAVAVVERTIGMNFEQTCRTTLLAQGDFARFLKSEDSEKAMILQRLVGADVYERIGQAINREKRAVEAAYRTAKALCDSLTPLKSAEVSGYKATLRETRAKLKSLETEVAVVDSELAWLRQLGVLSAALEKAERDEKSACEVRDSEATADMRRTVEGYALTAGVRARRADLRRVRGRIQTAENALSVCAAEARALGCKVMALGEKIKAKELVVHELDEALAPGRLRRPLYDLADTVLTLARNLASAVTAANQYDEQRAARQKMIADNLVPMAEDARKLVAEADADLEAADKAVLQCEAELTAAKLPELRAGLESLNNRNVALAAIERGIEDVEKLESEIDSFVSRLDTQTRTLDAINQKLPLLQELCTQSGDSLAAARHSREVTLKGLDNDVQALRAMLAEGDECPVCGARVGTALPVERSIRLAVAEADKAVALMQRRYDDNGRKLAEARSDFRNVTNNRQQLAADIGDKKTVLAAVRKSLSGQWQAAFGTAGPDKEAVRAERESLGGKIAGLTERIAGAEAIAARLEGLRGQQSEKRTRSKAAAERLREADEKLSAAGTELARLKGLAEAAAVNAGEIREHLFRILSDVGDPLPQTDKDIVQYAQNLCDERTAFVGRQNNLDAERQALDALKALAVDAAAAMQGLEAAVSGVPVAEGDCAVPKVADNRLEVEISALTQRARSLGDNLMQDKAECARICLDISGFMNAHADIDEAMLVRLEEIDESALADISQRLSQINDAAALAAGVHKQCRQQVDGHRQDCPPRFAGVSDEGLPGADALERQQTDLKARINDCQTSVAAIKQKLEANQKTADEYKARKAERKALERTLTDWKVLDNCFGTADGKRFRTIALSYILGSLVERANRYMATLTDRYRLSVSPGTFVILVADAYQGYRLRPTSSISGGESFMVSLSLALALSDISEVRGADILFIDEGFGSLSGQELDNAIETLRNLHDISHRRVGIISHLPRVSESLPVQICVHRATTTSPSGLIVTTVGDACSGL